MKNSTTTPLTSEGIGKEGDRFDHQEGQPRVSSSWRRFHGLCVRVGKTTKLVGLEATVHSLLKDLGSNGRDSYSRRPSDQKAETTVCSSEGASTLTAIDTLNLGGERHKRHLDIDTLNLGGERHKRHLDVVQADETCRPHRSALPAHGIREVHEIGESRLNRNREGGCRCKSVRRRPNCTSKMYHRSVHRERLGKQPQFREDGGGVSRLPWSVAQLRSSGQCVNRWRYRGVGPPGTREHFKVAMSLRRYETDWIAGIPESPVHQLGNINRAPRVQMEGTDDVIWVQSV